MNDRIRRIENLHVMLWLLKDCSWCAGWQWLGMFMVIPTLFVAAYITWQSRHSITEVVHNFAVCLWICANITWMTGEFFFNDTTRPIAKMFFFAGLIVLDIYYARAIVKRVNVWREARR